MCIIFRTFSNFIQRILGLVCFFFEQNSGPQNGPNLKEKPFFSIKPTTFLEPFSISPMLVPINHHLFTALGLHLLSTYVFFFICLQRDPFLSLFKYAFLFLPFSTFLSTDSLSRLSLFLLFNRMDGSFQHILFSLCSKTQQTDLFNISHSPSAVKPNRRIMCIVGCKSTCLKIWVVGGGSCGCEGRFAEHRPPPSTA